MANVYGGLPASDMVVMDVLESSTPKNGVPKKGKLQSALGRQHRSHRFDLFQTVLHVNVHRERSSIGNSGFWGSDHQGGDRPWCEKQSSYMKFGP